MPVHRSPIEPPTNLKFESVLRVEVNILIVLLDDAAINTPFSSVMIARCSVEELSVSVEVNYLLFAVLATNALLHPARLGIKGCY